MDTHTKDKQDYKREQLRELIDRAIVIAQELEDYHYSISDDGNAGDYEDCNYYLNKAFRACFA